MGNTFYSRLVSVPFLQYFHNKSLIVFDLFQEIDEKPCFYKVNLIKLLVDQIQSPIFGRSSKEHQKIIKIERSQLSFNETVKTNL